MKIKEVIIGKKGYSELSGPISWLCNAELIIKISICNKSEIPLMAFTKESVFKLYLMDIGLLGSMLGIPPAEILLGNYGSTKGYFAENFVVTELTAAGKEHLYGWNERNSEIEFLLTTKDGIIPLEVKSGIRTKAKSPSKPMQEIRMQMSEKQRTILLSLSSYM